MRGARMRTWIRFMLVVVACLGASTAATAAPVPLTQMDGASAKERTRSTRTAMTWTATVLRTTVARSRPSVRSRVISRLSERGANSPAHTVMATGAYRDEDGREWVRVQLISRPNESQGWVAADDVMVNRAPLRVEVHLKSRRLVILRGDTPMRTFRAGIGRVATPTPTGTFAVWDVWRTPPHLRGVYGSHVIALTAHSRVLRNFMGGDARIGIHGGGSIGRVGRRSSNGCVILAPDALAYVARYVRAGTQITVTND